jgi:LuxR family maltose regulon positive regulatory protein
MAGMSAAEVARRGAARAVGREVAIISAPAGSGKTSLLHAWADWPGQDRRITITRIR